MYQYWQTAVDVYLLDLSQPDTPGSHSKHKGWSRRGVGWQETLAELLAVSVLLLVPFLGQSRRQTCLAIVALSGGLADHRSSGCTTRLYLPSSSGF